MSMHHHDVYGDQKRASDALELELQMVSPCGCWELNPGPPEEQSLFLTDEPFLKPWTEDNLKKLVFSSCRLHKLNSGPQAKQQVLPAELSQCPLLIFLSHQGTQEASMSLNQV